jgi:6-phosphogluconolactonase
LTEIADSPFPAGDEPVSITVDPTGKFVYVANYGSNNVSAYTINPATGALTIIGDFDAKGTAPTSIVIVKVTTP